MKIGHESAESIFHKLNESGKEWAEKNALANQLEEMKKIILSRLKSKYPTDSNANAETKAMASDEFETHITGMVEARRQADSAKVEYESRKAYVELMRSAESTRRAEMGLR